MPIVPNLIRIARNLRRAGVVGINARNRGYVMAHNPRSLYQLVDDKVRTKQLAQAANIAVPELYGLITTVHDAPRFEKFVERRTDFVVKPAHGSGGKGVLVIDRRRNNIFYRADGVGLTSDAVRHHIRNILGGMYSLGGHPDHALIEYRVKFDPVFSDLSYRGVPDVRVLVYRGIPAMAMVRLPTRQSQGKANLHQGAVGCGIDMTSGLTTFGVCHNRQVHEHPDFDTLLAGRQIPNWDSLLLLAARCYNLAPLGYLGVDLVLDADLGPLVLELNARPGLSIQIANGCGLNKRLDAIDAATPIPETAEARVALMKSLTRHWQ